MLINVHRVGYADPRLLRMARLPPPVFAPRTCGRYAGPRALLNQPPLKLREGRKDMEHQLPRGGGRINRPIADGAESYLPSQQFLNDGHQMRHRPPEAVEPPDDQDIPGG
jgi:hypothetical protein